MRILVLLFIVSVFFQTQAVDLKVGTWRGVIDCQGHELPFTFDVVKKDSRLLVYLKNGAEKIELDEVSVFGDSVKMVLHIFDAELRAKINDNQLTGTFVKNYAPQANQPFRATHGENYRFVKNSTEKQTDYSGKYQIEFTNARGKKIPSVGLFQQTGNHLTGSFLTPTGDYRYLEGNVVDGTLMLSSFDGNHAYVFIASKKGDSLKGDYYAGKLTHETFKGIRSEQAKMPDAESLTYLKPGYDKIDFHFPDLNHKLISPADDKYKNKVVILQILGTWCPNCIDETNFLVPWYNTNRKRGVEIIGLAYERKEDFAYASERVKKMKEKLKVTYDLVIAGTDNTEKASQTLPMLNKIMGFPTTIIIGKDGKVKNIHTGFEGPGTGIYFEQYKERFNQIINELLAQKGTQ
ncbi:MAG: putative lipoprotein [Cytophagales bacterium]|jgi:thiol-disulfide isomerase/thioredoxin|nr:TlpA family protein disulfide reductase [Bacteroidota bacterium]MBS1980604.1 TlpA family protein disulfide reductase [Bacteroidota bacterium]WHZ07926.1 MAG: putative lipoprotein [Cytophagales bacterium]